MPAPLEFDGSPTRDFIESRLHERNQPASSGLFIINEYAWLVRPVRINPIRDWNLPPVPATTGEVGIEMMAPAYAVFTQFLADNGFQTLVPDAGVTGIQNQASRYFFFWPFTFVEVEIGNGAVGRGISPYKLLDLFGDLQEWPTYNNGQINGGSVNAIVQGGGGGIITGTTPYAFSGFDLSGGGGQAGGIGAQVPDAPFSAIFGTNQTLPSVTFTQQNPSHAIWGGIQNPSFTTREKLGAGWRVQGENRILGFSWFDPSRLNATHTVLLEAPGYGPVMIAQEVGLGRVVWIDSDVIYADPDQFNATLWLNILKWITRLI